MNTQTTISPEKHNIIIIGGGASGLMAAYSSCLKIKEQNMTPDVLILEGNNAAGKKITATGNGKCNFTNLQQDEECYRSSNPDSIHDVLKEFDEKKVLEFFKSIGVTCYEREGYCYPQSEQAKSIRDALENRVFRAGARIRYEADVKDIEFDRESREFTIICRTPQGNTSFTADKLIICSGGKAAPVFGTDGRVFHILERLEIPIIKPLPALCGLIPDLDLKSLDGVRTRCRCLLSGRNYSEYGEIIFTKNGISGIPIMNLSRYAVNALNNGLQPLLHLDFFHDYSENALSEYLFELINTSAMSPMKTYCGILNDRLLRMLLLKAGIQPEEKPDLSNSEALFHKTEALSRLLKDMTIAIKGYQNFENAQTTSGGVRLDAVDSELQSKTIPGLYFAGEVLDVDGKCGGYNLQWAWSSGYVAGRAAVGRRIDRLYDSGKFNKDKTE